ASEADMPREERTQRFLGAPGADSPSIQSLAAAIEQARRPAVVVGFQVSREGPGAERAFLEFAQRLNVPVFNSLAAKGTFPEHHPMAAGTFRGIPSERQLLDKADLLIMVGLDPIE